MIKWKFCRKKTLPAIMALSSLIWQTGVASAFGPIADNDFAYTTEQGVTIFVKAGDEVNLAEVLLPGTVFFFPDQSSGESDTGAGNNQETTTSDDKTYKPTVPQTYPGPHYGSYVESSNVKSPAEEAVIAAQATVSEKTEAVKELKKNVTEKSQKKKTSICLNSMAYEDYYKSLTNTNLFDTPVPSHVVGDPVFISGGMYYLDLVDDSFKYGVSEFNLKRTFVSSVRDAGAFGSSWNSSLDSRIIRGRSVSTEKLYDQYTAAISAANKEKDEHVSATHGNPSGSVMAKTYATINTYTEAKSKIESVRNQSIKNEKYNAYSLTAPYDYMDEIGVDVLMYIDENGGTNLMKLNDEQDKFYPYNNKEKKSLFYISYIDGNKDNGFEVHLPDGNTRQYNIYGRPVSFSDLNGNKIEFEYGSDPGKITGIKHKSKLMLEFIWDDGYVSEVRNKLTGQTKNYAYENELLLSVTDNGGAKTQFAYDADGDLIKFIKPDLTYINVTYGTVGEDKTKCTIQTSNEERWVEYFDWKTDSGVVIYTDAVGNQKKITFENGNQVKEENSDGTFEERVYNEKGQITSVTNNYGTKTYLYDSTYGYLETVVYPDGSMAKMIPYTDHMNPHYTVDRNGIQTEYFYDESGNTTKIVCDNKTIYTAKYNSWGGLESWSGIGGRGEYTYDTNYNLLTETKATYTYDTNGRLKSKTDYRDNKTTYRYENNGRTVIAESSNGFWEKTEEDLRGNVVKIVQKDARTGKTLVKESKYDRCNNLLCVMVGQGDSEEAAEKNKMLIESYGYNKVGNLIWMIKWNYGAARENDGDGIGYYFVWENGRLVKSGSSFVTEDAVLIGSEEAVTYRYSFEDGLLCTEEIDGNGNTRKTYSDEEGHVLKSVDALGREQTWTYSPAGQLVSETNIDGVTFNYAYDTATGRMISSSNSSGLESTKSYDMNGNLLSETLSDGSILNYSYVLDDKTLSVSKFSSVSKETSVFDLDGNRVGYFLEDGSGNSLVEQRYYYSDSGRELLLKENGIKTNHQFDAWGRQIYDSQKMEYYTYDSLGRLESVKSANGKNWQSFEFNALGKVSRKTVDGGNITDYCYNAQGNLASVKDLFGTVWEGSYDKAGRLVQEQGRLVPKTNYVYDEAGRLLETYKSGTLVEKRIYSDDSHTIQFVDGRGNARTECYDEYGKIVSVEDRLGNTKTYSYNDAENSQSVVDFMGRTTCYNFDKMQNQLTVTYDSGLQNTFAFDATGALVHVASSVPDSTDEENSGSRLQINQHYEYGANRLLSSASFQNIQKLAASTNTDEVKYEYDSANRLVKMIVGSETYSFAYDSLDRLTNLSTNYYSSEFFYDDFGREVRRKNSDCTEVLREYDELDRLTLLVHKDANGKTIFGEGTAYGDDGRIAYIVDNQGNFTHYEYDSMGRVSQVFFAYNSSYEESDIAELKSYGLNVKTPVCDYISVPSKYKLFLALCLNKMGVQESLLKSSQKCWTQSFEYDGNSNRISKTTPAGKIEYEYDAEDRLVKIPGRIPETFTYDANGNLILQQHGSKTTKYEYNEDDKLVSATVTDEETMESSSRFYNYDPMGRLVSQEDSYGNRVAFVYNGLGEELLKTYATDKAYSIKDSLTAGSGKSVRYVNPGAYSSHRDGESLVDSGSSSFSGSASGTAYLNKSDDTLYTGTRYFAYANGALCFQENDTEIYSICADTRNSLRSAVSVYSGKTFVGLYDAAGNVHFKTSDFKMDYSAEVMKKLGLETGFCGKLYDSTLDLYSYGQRFYNTSLGRFISQDPAHDGTNWYAYCDNDSINFVDEGGLRIKEPVIEKKMQEYGEDTKLGRSKNSYVRNEGCYLALVTDVVNSLTSKETGLRDINSMKRYFVDSCVRTDLLCKDFKLDHKEINCKKMSDAEKRKVIDHYKYSDNSYYMGIKFTLGLEYGTKKVEHFIATDGTVKRIGSMDYIRVVGTSLNDVPGRNGREDWFKDNKGHIYMPLEYVEEFRVFSRDNCMK